MGGKASKNRKYLQNDGEHISSASSLSSGISNKASTSWLAMSSLAWSTNGALFLQGALWHTHLPSLRDKKGKQCRAATGSNDMPKHDKACSISKCIGRRTCFHTCEKGVPGNEEGLPMPLPTAIDKLLALSKKST